MVQRVSNGRLCFQRAGPTTSVLAAYADSPLRILTPKNHGDAAWAYTSTLGGGLVGGDRLRLDIAVESAARAFVTTQGPTRIYRSAYTSFSEVSARIDADAALFFLPDPVSCFAGASYRQRTEISLAKTASVVAWDLLTAGRSANGERWAFRNYHAAFSVRREEKILLDDALLLDPAHGALVERLGRFDALATLFLIGPLFAKAREQLRARIDEGPLLPASPILSVCSPIGADALLVRFAARSVPELSAALRQHLSMIPQLLGDDPWARRN